MKKAVTIIVILFTISINSAWANWEERVSLTKYEQTMANKLNKCHFNIACEELVSIEYQNSAEWKLSEEKTKDEDLIETLNWLFSDN